MLGTVGLPHSSCLWVLLEPRQTRRSLSTRGVRGSDLVYLLLYVDDIVLTASSQALLQRIIAALQHEFSMKDLGELHHFLGMHVQRCGDGLLLSQRQYLLDILGRAGMADCKL